MNKALGAGQGKPWASVASTAFPVPPRCRSKASSHPHRRQIRVANRLCDHDAEIHNAAPYDDVIESVLPLDMIRCEVRDTKPTCGTDAHPKMNAWRSGETLIAAPVTTGVCDQRTHGCRAEPLRTVAPAADHGSVWGNGPGLPDWVPHAHRRATLPAAICDSCGSAPNCFCGRHIFDYPVPYTAIPRARCDRCWPVHGAAYTGTRQNSWRRERTHSVQG